MKNKWILIIISVFVLLIAAALVWYFGFWQPYQNAESFITRGDLEITQQTDGSLVLTWPKSQYKDRYLLQIYEENNSGEKSYHVNTNTTEERFVLPDLPDDKFLTISIHTVVDYKQLWMEKTRFCEYPLSVKAKIDIPKVNNLDWTADVKKKTITVTFETNNTTSNQLFIQKDDQSWAEVFSTDTQTLQLDFSPSGSFNIPDYEKPVTFRMSAFHQKPGLKIYGTYSAQFKIEREDLLGRDLNLKLNDEGNNVCTLSWDETKGKTYCVQRLNHSTDEWDTLAEIPYNGERIYTSLHMPAFKTFEYRVIAVGGQVMEGSEYAAVSDIKEQITKESPVFCTIWPTKDLPAYQTQHTSSKEVATAKAGIAYCVLDERGGMFKIRVDGKNCYVESKYCLINLTEYLQDKCKYDITNSYASLYMVHEFEIPEVTDVVTGGYENVELDSGSYLVPLLYPTAQRLVAAANDALDQGYILKIYDSFRPQKATREIYDLTEKIINENIPEAPFTDKKTIEELELPEQKTEINPETGEETLIPLTYTDVMVNEEFGLSNFLAKGGSMHNYGLALDLTLENIYTGEELEMQTSMHDLSCYSVLKKNNKNANLLKQIMTGAGFGGLLSEWWHYQDNTTRDTQSTSALWYGVSASCWMADDYGWRYRNVYGNYYKDCEITLNDVVYTFDEKGYVINN